MRQLPSTTMNTSAGVPWPGMLNPGKISPRSKLPKATVRSMGEWPEVLVRGKSARGSRCVAGVSGPDKDYAAVLVASTFSKSWAGASPGGRIGDFPRGGQEQREAGGTPTGLVASL